MDSHDSFIRSQTWSSRREHFWRRGRTASPRAEPMRSKAVTHDEPIGYKAFSLHVDDNGDLESTSRLMEVCERGKSRRDGGVVHAE